MELQRNGGSVRLLDSYEAMYNMVLILIFLTILEWMTYLNAALHDQGSFCDRSINDIDFVFILGKSEMALALVVSEIFLFKRFFVAFSALL